MKQISLIIISQSEKKRYNNKKASSCFAFLYNITAFFGSTEIQDSAGLITRLY
jgi:hypothetical protein